LRCCYRCQGGTEASNPPRDSNSATTRAPMPATGLQDVVKARLAVSGPVRHSEPIAVRGGRIKRPRVAAPKRNRALSFDSCLGCCWPAGTRVPQIIQDAICLQLLAPTTCLSMPWLLEPQALPSPVLLDTQASRPPLRDPNLPSRQHNAKPNANASCICPLKARPRAITCRHGQHG
jgi:hypothetical protein